MSALLCAVSVALVAAAPQQLSRESRMLFETAPARLEARVGEWVTYQMDGAPQQGFMRLAVVGEEKDAKGRDAVWVEMEFGRHSELKAPLAQYLMLVTRDVGLRSEGVTRLFVSQGYEKLQELEQDAVAHFMGTPKPEAPPAPLPASTEQISAGPDTSVTRGKPARVMTLAGTVQAEPMEVRYRQLVIKRYWISREVPILRLAKIEFPPIQYTMEVRDYGVDARPRMVRPSPNDKKMILGTEEQLPSRFKFQPPAETDSESKDNRP
ncbi:hypothetical protein CYFUS_006055 [Cystobacter fuscus]|uniref:Uncharacterized protein n=1 Tax=Cystobacter fuscus TaxID=43 RepID=A0A250J9K7_9BACT|nr:hypothetical protein [Cystobacter fuscus]ATB40604.1 hypothetical protein CYFUS_006055 [Cystobacter fuscus]